MHVLGERPEASLAVPAADGDDRELAVEGDDLLGQLVGRRAPRRADPALPLAVVAEPARLDERRQPRLGERAEARRRDPEAPEELLLDEPVLPSSSAQRRRQGADAHAAASTGTFSNS